MPVIIHGPVIMWSLVNQYYATDYSLSIVLYSIYT